jgi:nucleotide-binding universal stress UspA family protein
MNLADAKARVSLQNILFATDFSEPSEAALPLARSIARGFGSNILAVHVLTPGSYPLSPPETAAASAEAVEEFAEAEMQLLESQLAGLPYETFIERDVAVWPALQRIIKDRSIDLVVLGTHGRTGAQKLLMGSVAEEIFRQSPVPVITIGPRVRRGLHGAAQFHRVLFATDFTPESLVAAPYAVSLAQEHQARLTLVHVVPLDGHLTPEKSRAQPVAALLHGLGELVPSGAELWCHPETIVEYGDPAERIVAAAHERGADLIVLGVRGARGHLGAATHLERATAHKVVAHADCPVMTVRG